MSKYEEGMRLLNQRFGNGKDNVIALATVSLDTDESGLAVPSVRDVDAHYEDGVFYAVTYKQSNKMKQIEINSNAAISANFEDFHANVVATDLGWVLDPKNADLRNLLRVTFKEWYDFANDETDKNCCFLELKMTKGVLRINHGEAFYHFDFINKSA